MTSTGLVCTPGHCLKLDSLHCQLVQPPPPPIARATRRAPVSPGRRILLWSVSARCWRAVRPPNSLVSCVKIDSSACERGRSPRASMAPGLGWVRSSEQTYASGTARPKTEDRPGAVRSLLCLVGLGCAFPYAEPGLSCGRHPKPVPRSGALRSPSPRAPPPREPRCQGVMRPVSLTPIFSVVVCGPEGCTPCSWENRQESALRSLFGHRLGAYANRVARGRGCAPARAPGLPSPLVLLVPAGLRAPFSFLALT